MPVFKTAVGFLLLHSDEVQSFKYPYLLVGVCEHTIVCVKSIWGLLERWQVEKEMGKSKT